MLARRSATASQARAAAVEERVRCLPELELASLHAAACVYVAAIHVDLCSSVDICIYLYISEYIRSLCIRCVSYREVRVEIDTPVRDCIYVSTDWMLPVPNATRTGPTESPC